MSKFIYSKNVARARAPQIEALHAARALAARRCCAAHAPVVCNLRARCSSLILRHARVCAVYRRCIACKQGGDDDL